MNLRYIDDPVKLRQRAARLLLPKVVDPLSDEFPRQIKKLNRVLETKTPRELQIIIKNGLKSKGVQI